MVIVIYSWLVLALMGALIVVSGAKRYRRGAVVVLAFVAALVFGMHFVPLWIGHPELVLSRQRTERVGRLRAN